MPLNPWRTFAASESTVAKRSKMFQAPVENAAKVYQNPIVNKQFAIENNHRNSGFTHEKLWFSIVFCKRLPEGRGKWWKKGGKCTSIDPNNFWRPSRGVVPQFWGQSYLQPLRSLWQGAEGIIWCLWITWGWKPGGVEELFFDNMGSVSCENVHLQTWNHAYNLCWREEKTARPAVLICTAEIVVAWAWGCWSQRLPNCKLGLFTWIANHKSSTWQDACTECVALWRGCSSPRNSCSCWSCCIHDVTGFFNVSRSG